MQININYVLHLIITKSSWETTMFSIALQKGLTKHNNV